MEFAIVAPLLFVLIFGIIEFGIILYDKAMITNASREGARAGVVFRADPSTGHRGCVPTEEINSKIYSYLGGASYPSLISFSPSAIEPPKIPVLCNNPGTSLSVTVTYQYRFLILAGLVTLFGEPLDWAITLSGVTVMQCE